MFAPYLAHKIVGATTSSGLSFEQVAVEVKRALDMVCIMGVVFSVCALPCQVSPDRLEPGMMELGLGIHGEPGAAMVGLQPADIVVDFYSTLASARLEGLKWDMFQEVLESVGVIQFTGTVLQGMLYNGYI